MSHSDARVPRPATNHALPANPKTACTAWATHLTLISNIGGRLKSTFQTALSFQVASPYKGCLKTHTAQITRRCHSRAASVACVRRVCRLSDARVPRPATNPALPANPKPRASLRRHTLP
ncbi:hypothetical protein [Kingella potus]|uniref:hypothetical protein n=1 Tax=Kingella potus TaxID=265175 RepID=UPI001FD1112E|nr:hypothetical protein [Kingella potus]UOP00965.1 hypothetical protein LVJ84_00675 [Kingella potus]